MSVWSDAMLQKKWKKKMTKTNTDIFFNDKCSIKVINETCVTRSVSREKRHGRSSARTACFSPVVSHNADDPLAIYISPVSSPHTECSTRTPPNPFRVYGPKSKNDLTISRSAESDTFKLNSVISHTASC